MTGDLIIEFGENQLKDFLEDIHARISEDFVFEVLDELAQRTGLDSLRFTLFFFFDECLYCPWLSSNIFDGLGAAGRSGIFIK